MTLKIYLKDDHASVDWSVSSTFRVHWTTDEPFTRFIELPNVNPFEPLIDTVIPSEVIEGVSICGALGSFLSPLIDPNLYVFHGAEFWVGPLHNGKKTFNARADSIHALRGLILAVSSGCAQY